MVYFLIAVSVMIHLPVRPTTEGPTIPLTTDEIKAGWLALYDGVSDFGWLKEGEVEWSTGHIKLSGATSASIASTSAFGSFDLIMEYRFEGGQGGFEFLYGDGQSKLTRTHEPKDQTIDRIEFHCPNMKKTDRIMIRTLPGTTLIIKSIKLKPLELKDIFNGKNLSGWKAVENNQTKTQFSITDAGELRLQNGPGDLQTEDSWDDFVLQLDVKSNGKHLNSGVFYRCLPGRFWSGYEAQIRNQWEGENRHKPVDFGTGGIYNRQPARVVVSNDHEYFKLTIIAHGTHMATWVNGYQVTDFTDKAKLGNNARRGAKIEAGPISLQGHDPTTDLSFKNIRITSLPKKQ